MGILKYNEFLKKFFDDSINQVENEIIKYNNVYIDLNFLLHYSMYLTFDKKSFFKRLFSLLDSIIKKCFALNVIMLSIDGTSPYSKIILQRKRRASNLKKINMKNINVLHLTPGTLFMDEIKNEVSNYIKNVKKKMFKFRNIKFIFSSSDESGEGEIKIIKKIIFFNKKNKNYKHLIIGNDADLIVMAMACTKVKNIDILNKTNYGYNIIKINNIVLKMTKIINFKSKYIKRIRTDFALISIMMGNDYLSKLKYVKNDILLESYYKTKKYNKGFIIKKGTFNIYFFKKYLINLILNLNKRYQKINLKNFNNKNIKKYLEGLLWCNKMYSSGVCPMYDYIFDDKSPTPAEILFYLEFNNILNINIPQSNIKPISNKIYPLLVLPKKASELIPSNYKNLIETKFNFLYNSNYNFTINDIKKIINSEDITNTDNIDNNKIYTK
jgi:5'-3' exonuclease